MLKFILPALFICFFVSAQEKKDDVAATAGDIQITRFEFEERFQLNPQVSIHRRSQGEANKKNFLYGLIAEKLLSLEAEEKGMDTVAIVRYFLKNFEKMFVRDELYRKMVTLKSSEYAENLLSFYLNNSTRVFTKTIISNNKDQIRGIYNMLAQGVPFDSVYAELSPQERDTITIYAGTLDERTEKEIFALPEKHFSKPMQYNEHWVIFYIENKSNPVIAKSMGWESEFKRLERVSKEKAEAVFFKQYMETFFASKKVDAKGFFIKSLGDKIYQTAVENRKNDTSGYHLSSNDIVKITRSFPADSLEAPFIIFEKEKILFGDFLLWLRTEVFEVKDYSPEKITAQVSAKVKKFIEYELLAQEGYRQGLDKSETVKKMCLMWRDNYLYQLRLSDITDSLLNNNNNELVKFAIITNNNLDIIENVLNKVSSGEDFIQLAKEYSDADIDTSYRRLSDLDEIKDEIMQSAEGDIVGPVKTDEGYTLFKVLDRKISSGSTGLMTDQEGKNPFDSHIANLARKYGVSINDSIFPEIKSSNVNAVIFKYLGFGGRLPAVPIINPISGWHQEWKKDIPLNP